MSPSTAAKARDAIARGNWTAARSHLEDALAAKPAPDLYEELGLVGWWLNDASLVFDARERAYSLYREADDHRGAARVAIWLAWDYLAFRNDFAVSAGWLERARRLLESDRRSAEYGWLLVREGEVALFRGHDPALTVQRTRAARRLARTLGDESIEFTALALEGLAKVSAGDVAGGMRALDEASIAATVGEMRELHAVGLVCCWQIFACERTRDFERASQWCERVEEFSRRWGLQPLSAVCRTQYAGVLIWRGEWSRAEEELSGSIREFGHVRPGLAGSALLRLAELRLRQGSLADAERLFVQSGSAPTARIGLATVMREKGASAESVAMLEEVLASAGDTEVTLRISVLEALVRSHLANADVEGAIRSCRELDAIAARVGTTAFAASATTCQGLVRAARGQHRETVRLLERGVELFLECGAPYETAGARIALGEALIACGREEAAAIELALASAEFERLGATRELSRARRMLSTPVKGKERKEITARQLEILRLVAKGKSNAQIAKGLGLSEHTVKRHVANLLMRIDVSSRAAAAAYAAREGLL